MDWNKSRVLVAGAAKSGREAAKFLLRKGASVIIYDQKEEAVNREMFPDAGEKLLLMFGPEPDVNTLRPDLIVVSPGVPFDKPFLVQAREKGIEIIGELELAWRFSRTPFIAITGTNGKTTTTTLVGELFKAGGAETLVGGNIGNPLINEVEVFPGDGIIVAEVSSFQLESIRDFHAHVAIVTNLTPDHLDRHKTMELYKAAKARVFENQGSDDYLILNYDDEAIRDLAEMAKGKVLFFSRKIQPENGAYLKEGRLFIRMGGNEEEILPPEEIFIKGGHNLENAMAAALAARACGIPPQTIAETLRTFRGVEHRLEYVGEFDGVVYVNDSKGTNPDASLKALAAYDAPMVIIAGGRNKGNSFGEYAKVIAEKCRFAVLIGESKEEIRLELDKLGFNSYFMTDDFQEAVAKAREVAQPGDVVMLSPACASWDMFPNYEVRGNQFKEFVIAGR